MRAQLTMALACLGLVSVVTGCTVEAVAPTAEPSPLSSEARTGVPVDSTLAPAVLPVIVVADVDVDGQHVTSSGYVAGILEADGTCTFRFESVDAEVSAESIGIADRSTTVCESVHVPIAEFVRGTWLVTLTYTGVMGEQWVSESVTMEVA